MRRIVGSGTSIAAAVVALSVVLSGSANGAEAVAGPGGSLTVVQGVGSLPNGSTLYAFSGSLESGFSVPVQISQPGDAAEDPSLVVDRAGDALAVWTASRTYQLREPDSGPSLIVPRGIWYTWRPAGGSFSRPRQLAAPAPGQKLAAAAMDEAGEAAVAYEERGSVYLRRARANRDFGAAATVTPGVLKSSGPTTELDYVGLDGAGELLVVTSSAGSIQARFAAAGRKLGNAQMIGRRLPKGESPSQVSVAMDALGAAAIAWEDRYLSGPLVVYREARRRFGSPQPLVATRTPSQPTALPVSIGPAVMDERGHAIFVLLRHYVGGVDPPSWPETSEWDGQGAPSAPTPVATHEPIESGSFAENEAGEAAISYEEPVTRVGESFATQFAVNVRFSSNRQAFGATQTLSSGTSDCLNSERTELLVKRNPACEGIPALVGARGGAFFAVFTFWAGPSNDTYEQVVRIQSVSQAGTSPPAYISVSDFVLPQPQLDPASFVDFGATPTADTHGRIHGEVECGSNEGGCSVQISVVDAAEPRLTLGAAAWQLNRFGRQPIAVTLNRLARRQLAARGRLAVRLVTHTKGTYGPALETTYPLNILRAHHG